MSTIYYIMCVLFENRIHAGKELSNRLDEYFKKENMDANDVKNSVIVLAIPRGGVILGDVIASDFHCEFDVIVSRKIRAEFNEEFAIGAVMPDGTYFIHKNVLETFKIRKEYLDEEIENQKKEIHRRLIEFRGSTTYDNKLKDKIVILVDDGIATGATIIASAQWIKRRHECRQLIVAVPVAPLRDETIEKLNQIADKVIVLHLIEDFYAVGQFYEDFRQVSDEEVKKMMKKYHYDI